MMGTLRGMITKNPAEKILMESHKNGGKVGSKQKKRDMGGTMAPNSILGRGGYSKGGACRKKKDMGGEMDPSMGKAMVKKPIGYGRPTREGPMNRSLRG